MDYRIHHLYCILKQEYCIADVGLVICDTASTTSSVKPTNAVSLTNEIINMV